MNLQKEVYTPHFGGVLFQVSDNSFDNFSILFGA
jgi:hypothetical protein